MLKPRENCKSVLDISKFTTERGFLKIEIKFQITKQPKLRSILAGIYTAPRPETTQTRDDPQDWIEKTPDLE